MKRASGTTVRNQLNIRASQAQREVIDQAAALLGKTRTDFILESALRDARQTLLDQSFFHLDDASFDRVVELLDHPPKPSAELRELLGTRGPWK